MTGAQRALYWAPHRPGTRWSAAPLVIPDADPEEQTVEPAYLHSFVMDDPRPGLIGRVYRADRPGEYRFARRDYVGDDGSSLVGTPVAPEWAVVKSVNLGAVSVALQDSDNNELTPFLLSLRNATRSTFASLRSGGSSTKLCHGTLQLTGSPSEWSCAPWALTSGVRRLTSQLGE